uniref:Cell cycle control protein n=1 Tax=Callorhinchus milii TaxID=7868 RepID=V9KRG2_CALMI
MGKKASREKDSKEKGDTGLESEDPLNQPDNSAFKQQRLPAWTPFLNAKNVLPTIYITGVFCISVGIFLLVIDGRVKEFQVDYTDGACQHCSLLREDWRNWTKPCTCTINFTLEESFQGDVFMYYGLRNYYQNHRQYGISRDNAQLLGLPRRLKTPSDSCQPFNTDGNGNPIAPCGAVANSLFNDTFSLLFLPNTSCERTISLLDRDITWWTDRNIKFRNPVPHNNLSAAFAGTVRPPNWQKDIYTLGHGNNNGFVNEDFIVWMRTDAFPNFRKLYRYLDRKEEFLNGLPAGNYSIKIQYNYPVTAFGGRKEMILSTMSWMGSKNSFLGIAYCVTGALSIIAGVLLTFVSLKFGKKRTAFKR